MSAVQLQAAELLRRGYTQRAAAATVGRSERTIRAWLHDAPGFRETAERDPEVGAELTALETLRSALTATRSDGSADWSVRVRAARALVAAGDPQPAPVVSVPPGGTVIYPEVLEQLAGDPS
ncbi:MAG TPA: helix-turn-helix domain-containing protein [Gaiellaceae bacterium]|nr:helix-turn-helix domain-containing protein [Gaiellaceae bacterium]